MLVTSSHVEGTARGYVGHPETKNTSGTFKCFNQSHKISRACSTRLQLAVVLWTPFRWMSVSTRAHPSLLIKTDNQVDAPVTLVCQLIEWQGPRMLPKASYGGHRFPWYKLYLKMWSLLMPVLQAPNFLKNITFIHSSIFNQHYCRRSNKYDHMLEKGIICDST